MRYEVWWHCPVHNRWEEDSEGLTWDEAVERAKKIQWMTGRETAIEKGKEDELPMVSQPDASTQGQGVLLNQVSRSRTPLRNRLEKVRNVHAENRKNSQKSTSTEKIG
jgi:adenylylsulfate kinase-like enzyme